MRIKKNVLTTVAGLGAAVLIAGGVALAEGGPRPKPVDRFRVDPALKKAFEQQAEQMAELRPSPGVALVGEAMELQARVEAVIDGRALVSVPLDAEAEAGQVFARRAQSQAEIGDNTIYQGRLYVLYPIAAGGPDNLEQMVGKDVSLELRRDDHDVARLTFLRTK
mgnify:CR=1 FL=1